MEDTDLAGQTRTWGELERVWPARLGGHRDRLNVKITFESEAETGRPELCVCISWFYDAFVKNFIPLLTNRHCHSTVHKNF